ncbi:MAG: hypothetical protein M3312_07715 [Actinomycetota bacterium]|nr:hypothetical protein [Actinomycetota bacterium]
MGLALRESPAPSGWRGTVEVRRSSATLSRAIRIPLGETFLALGDVVLLVFSNLGMPAGRTGQA